MDPARPAEAAREDPLLSPWAIAAGSALGVLLFIFPLASLLPRSWQHAFWHAGFYQLPAILAAAAVLLGIAAVFMKPCSRFSIVVGITSAVLGSAWLGIALPIGQALRGYLNG